MFNSRFDYLRFGLRADESQDIAIVVDFSDALRNVSGSGSLIEVELALFDRLQAESRATPTHPISLIAATQLQTSLNIIGGVVAEALFEEALLYRAKGAKNIDTTGEGIDALSSKAYIGQNTPVEGRYSSLSDSLQGISYAVKDIKMQLLLTSLLHSIVSTVILEAYSMTISVELPAGSSLEIRSDTYDVYLDGVNILHLHSGDWVFLDRDVVAIEVDSGTGGELQGQVMYNERYL